MRSAARHPPVSLVTSHGRQVLDSLPGDRVLDVLIRHGISWSAVSIYVTPAEGGAPRLRACLDERLDTIDDAGEVILYFNRNIDPFALWLRSFTTVASAQPGEEATEYFYQQADASEPALLKKLSPEECRTIIASRMADTVADALPRGADLVVGVSGGGDSNALLYGLTQLTDHGLRLHPVILRGIPDWDAGVPRARELCDRYGLELTVLEEADVRALLGMPDDKGALIDRFEREFEGDDFEFLGTLLIRLGLFAHARRVGTTFVCTGLNLEDVLCESMFRLATGRKPAPFPVRTIGDTTLVMPLWLCPKRIIDGCFPRYSLENYGARYPGFSPGRNLYYNIVFGLQSQSPAYAEQLAAGLSAVSLEDPVSYTFDERLGFHVEAPPPFPLVRRFERMVGRSGPPSLAVD